MSWPADAVADYYRKLRRAEVDIAEAASAPPPPKARKPRRDELLFGYWYLP